MQGTTSARALALTAMMIAFIVSCGSTAVAAAAGVASGIGGGSADAAATLRVLSRLWQVAVRICKTSQSC